MNGYQSVPATVPTFPLPLVCGTRVTITNQANATQFLTNLDAFITAADLSLFSQVRLVTRVSTASASANTPQIQLRYRTSFSTTATNYSAIGTSEVKTSLAATGVIDSGWIDLVDAAKSYVYLCLIQTGGDAAADPTIGYVTAHFR